MSLLLYFLTTLRLFLLLFFLFSEGEQLQFNTEKDKISVISWNLRDFGSSKTNAEIEFIASTVKNYDIVLIQEVVANDPGGSQAVGRLGDALNRKGAKWEYRISDPTSGDSPYKKERYAFLWKPSKVHLTGKPWLEQKYAAEIGREPFYATFKAGSKEFTLVNFHGRTKSAQPETEVKYFKFLPGEYPKLNLIFCGDFNLPSSHTVFNPLKKMGYQPALTGQKTSMRQECKNDDCLASEFDNIFYKPATVKFEASGVIHFYKSLRDFKEARNLSDHVPIYFGFFLN